jgi:hypothetical protein
MSWERKTVKRGREEEEWLPRVAALLPCATVCESNGSRVEWMWSSSSMYLCCSLSLSLIISTSPVDVGDLPNHVKYCVSVLNLQWATIRTSPVGIPNNWYQSLWFKMVFDFCPKIKVVKMVFWSYHHVEEEETSTLVKTTQNLDIENGRTRHHAPARRLSTRTDTPHAFSSLGWADLTRIPDDPTHVTNPDKDDISMT